MKIETVRISARNTPDEPRRWSVALCLPCFSEDVPGYEALTDFYERLAEAVTERAKALSCTVFSHVKLACAEDSFYSLVLDFLFFRGRDMTDCQRLTDTRRWDGILLPPPRQVKRQIPPRGGWYFDGENYVLFDNTFTPEQGVRARRSSYGIFLPETVF